MLPPGPVPAASPRLPELVNRGVVLALLALGIAGLLTESLSTVFLPRLVLFLTVLAFGTIGFVRCRRTERREHGGAVVMAIRRGSRSPGSR